MLSVVAVAGLMCAVATTPALAEGNVSYMDKNGKIQQLDTSAAIDITNATGTVTLEGGKTYYITADRKYDERLEVSGSATLVVLNGARVNCDSGIHCQTGNSITLTSDVDKQGKIDALLHWKKQNAGIGGNEDQGCGEVAICGLVVNAHGDTDSAGIGGGDCGDGGKIIIRNADVTAQGGSRCASGIGGGGMGCIHDAGDGGDVLIVDSKVTAKSSWHGAGIGGGGDESSTSADQGDGGNVTILGNSYVDAEGGDGAAIGRGDDEGYVGTVKLADHLKVTDLSLNEGMIATAAEREGYCLYRNHVIIETCDHQGASFEKSPSSHKCACPHCRAFSDTFEFHEFDKDDNCVVCGHHLERPFFAEPEMGEGDQDYVIFWFDVNGMDEETFKRSYIDIEVTEPGKEPLKRRDNLTQWGERKGDLRSYATWVLDDVSDDALVTATVHYGKGLSESQSVTLGDIRSAANERTTEAQ